MYQSVDYDMINIMSYLHFNNQVSNRVTFNHVEEALKKFVGEQKREDRKVVNQN
jgi:hypothetical protein